jgi:hypothetical protein
VHAHDTIVGWTQKKEMGNMVGRTTWECSICQAALIELEPESTTGRRRRQAHFEEKHKGRDEWSIARTKKTNELRTMGVRNAAIVRTVMRQKTGEYGDHDVERVQWPVKRKEAGYNMKMVLKCTKCHFLALGKAQMLARGCCEAKKTGNIGRNISGVRRFSEKCDALRKWASKVLSELHSALDASTTHRIREHEGGVICITCGKRDRCIKLLVSKACKACNDYGDNRNRLRTVRDSQGVSTKGMLPGQAAAGPTAPPPRVLT